MFLFYFYFFVFGEVGFRMRIYPLLFIACYECSYPCAYNQLATPSHFTFEGYMRFFSSFSSFLFIPFYDFYDSSCTSMISSRLLLLSAFWS
jgi:hypothetical protein